MIAGLPTHNISEFLVPFVRKAEVPATYMDGFAAEGGSLIRVISGRT